MYSLSCQESSDFFEKNGKLKVDLYQKTKTLVVRSSGIAATSNPSGNVMRTLFLSFVCLFLTEPLLQAQEPNYTRKEDVVYGRKYGMALTLDVFTPKKDANGAGVIFCVSGGWFSSKEAINPVIIGEALNRGYVVFAVVHGSQPRFTIPEVLDDMQRATRFIHLHAKEYGVDPKRLGITGGSAGGHLSLMQGVGGNEGNPNTKDAVEKESSKVAAVACFFPPTDFLNYGKEGEIALGGGTLKGFRAPFNFIERDPSTNAFVVITDEEKRKEIGKRISPVYHVTEKTPPTLIIHGDADRLVPIQQAELMIEKLTAKKIPCELVVRKGAGHGWPTLIQDTKIIVDWFDKYIGK